MSIESTMDSLREWIDAYLPHGSLRRRLVRGTFWSTVGTLVAQGLGLVASVLVVRMLGREPFGEFSMIRSTVMMFGVFAGLSLGMTTTKYVAEYRQADRDRAGRVIGMSATVSFCSASVIALVLLVFAPYLAARTMNAPHLVPELRIGCLTLLFEALNGVQLGTLAGFESFRTIAWTSFLRGILNFPLMIVGVYYGGLRGAVWALAASAAAGWVINHVALRSLVRRENVHVAFRNVRSELPILWHFALPALISGAMVVPVVWAANAIVANTEHGYDSLGVFNAANQWQLPITLLASQIGAILLPMLSSFSLDVKGRAKEEVIQNATCFALMLVVLPTVAFLSCFSGTVIAFYGRNLVEYPGARAVLLAVLFVGGLKAFGTIAGSAIASRGAMWSAFAINSSWAALLLILVYSWTSFGPEGLANAFSAAYGMLTVLGLVYCGIMGYCSWGVIRRIWFAGACVGVFSYGMGYVDLFIVRFLGFLAATAVALGSGYLAWRNYGKRARTVN